MFLLPDCLLSGIIKPSEKELPSQGHQNAQAEKVTLVASAAMPEKPLGRSKSPGLKLGVSSLPHSGKRIQFLDPAASPGGKELEKKMRFEEIDTKISFAQPGLLVLEPFSASRHTSLEQELEKIDKAYDGVDDSLKETFKKLLKCIYATPSLAAYRKVDPKNLYKLFMNANCWPEKIQNDSYKGHSALYFDAREPGYMNAMANAFIWLMTLNKPLSAEMIQELHDRAIEGVSENVGGGELVKFKEGFRSSQDQVNESFKLVLGETVSPSGFVELAKKFSNPDYNVNFGDGLEQNLFEVGVSHPKQSIRIFELPKNEIPTFEEIRNVTPDYNWDIPSPIDGSLQSVEVPKQLERLRSLKLTFDAYKEAEGKRKQTTLDERFSRIKDLNKKGEKLSNPNNFVDTLSNIMVGVTNLCMKLNRPLKDSFLPLYVNKLSEIYQSASKKTASEEEIRKAILLLIQDLEQIHAFYDANTRSYGFLLVNKLLVDHGLTPTCFDEPHCIDCLSIDELQQHLDKGQANFKALMSS